jgi:hypothetical protein
MSAGLLVIVPRGRVNVRKFVCPAIHLSTEVGAGPVLNETFLPRVEQFNCAALFRNCPSRVAVLHFDKKKILINFW